MKGSYVKKGSVKKILMQNIDPELVTPVGSALVYGTGRQYHGTIIPNHNDPRRFSFGGYANCREGKLKHYCVVRSLHDNRVV